MTPGHPLRGAARASCMNRFTSRVRSFLSTSFTKTIASRTVSASPAPIDA